MHMRKNWLAVMSLLAAAVALCLMLAPAGSVAAETDRGWDGVPEILSRIVAPTFPNRDFPVTDFGAKGDGQTDCTESFAKAIAACNAAGGGRVVVPPGEFLTGPIHLKSNVNLHVSKGATIAFRTDPNAYLPAVLTRFESIECMNYSPLIYALDQENIAITGEGTLDGRAGTNRWWHWKGRWGGEADVVTGWSPGDPDQHPANGRLKQMAIDGVPVAERVFGNGDNLRPNFIQPYRCRNVLIEGVTLRNSPMWNINPVLCKNVTVRRVKVDSHGPNNDGCNPESSSDVLIERCEFDTGDDCIAIKSGRDHDGRRVNMPSENIVIRGCRMKDGHGGVVIGSETSGGVRNVFAEDCEMDSPHLDRALRIKSNSLRGGLIENIYMRNVTVGQVAEAVLRINMLYDKDRDKYNPIVRNVELRGVTCKRSRHAFRLEGLPGEPIRNVRIIDCVLENVSQPSIIEHVESLSVNNTTIRIASSR
jgi:polygalacturonase